MPRHAHEPCTRADDERQRVAAGAGGDERGVQPPSAARPAQCQVQQRPGEQQAGLRADAVQARAAEHERQVHGGSTARHHQARAASGHECEPQRDGKGGPHDAAPGNAQPQPEQVHQHRRDPARGQERRDLDTGDAHLGRGNERRDARPPAQLVIECEQGGSHSRRSRGDVAASLPLQAEAEVPGQAREREAIGLFVRRVEEVVDAGVHRGGRLRHPLLRSKAEHHEIRQVALLQWQPTRVVHLPRKVLEVDRRAGAPSGGPPAHERHLVLRTVLQRHGRVVRQLGVGVEVAVGQLQHDGRYRPEHTGHLHPAEPILLRVLELDVALGTLDEIVRIGMEEREPHRRVTADLLLRAPARTGRPPRSRGRGCRRSGRTAGAASGTGSDAPPTRAGAWTT